MLSICKYNNFSFIDYVCPQSITVDSDRVNNVPQDPDTVYFNGANNVLSNFHTNKLMTGDGLFKSAEHSFQFRMANLLNYSKLANHIQNAPTASEAKSRARSLPKNRDLEQEVLWEVITAMVTPALRRRMTACDG